MYIKPGPGLRFKVSGPPQHPAIRIAQDQPKMASRSSSMKMFLVCRGDVLRLLAGKRSGRKQALALFLSARS